MSGQPNDKQSDISQCFDRLMEGIERTLLPKNRDKYVPMQCVTSLPVWFTHVCFVLFIYCRFTQNLSVFRRDVNEALKAPSHVSNGVAADGMMS